MRVQLPARGLFMSLEPQLVESESYGRLNLGSEDIADRINASVQKVRQAMRELINARILIEDAEGYRCPYLEDERKNFALREEIKAVFARVAIIHVQSVQDENGSPISTGDSQHQDGPDVQ